MSEIRYPKYEKYSKHDKQKKPGYFARIGIFFQNAKRILKIANKPSRKDYFTVFKICAIGTVILGALSFVIQLIFNVVGFGVK
ncbi:MAG: protein translocase SEC61 complex subunit gamma [Candidatus Lokiarchaeota archaeon]|nr:protein translocase SEC61 complex subunit gamma [Candidatus Lokiarchaeota archaeon]